MILFPFLPLRLLASMAALLPLMTLHGEASGEVDARNHGLTPSYLGNTLYRGQSQHKESFEHWQTRLWGASYGNWEHRLGDADSVGFYADTWGITAGFDCRRNSRLTWGWAAGGSWISASGDSGPGVKHIAAVKTMLNAAWESTDWRLQATAGYGNNSQRVERSGYTGQYGGQNRADQWGIRTEFQLKLGTGLFATEPFAGLDCMTFAQRTYSERVVGGTGQPQSFAAQTDNSYASVLGLRYRWRQTGQLVVWRPELTAAWFHEFGSDRVFRSSQLDPFPTLLTFPDSFRPRNHLLGSVAIVGHLGSTMDIFARYAADIAGDDTAHAVLIGTHWKF